MASWAIATVGAGLWPGLGEIAYIDRGRFRAVEFGLQDVRAVKVGEGWADGGIDIVLLPYKRAIDALAAVRRVPPIWLVLTVCAVLASLAVYA